MAEPVELHALLRFAIALFIGALVGIDREKKRLAETDREISGLRTFILIALSGALAAWLAQRFDSPGIFFGTGALVAAIVVTGYAVAARRHASYGLTSEVAALVVYLLGGMTLAGDPELAVALAIATAAVLAFKEPLHGAVAKIDRDDLYAGLTLLICTFIVLPVLPDHAVDPWNALNPYRMWWLVILISGLSLVGYVATRVLGPEHGVPLTGLVGGLVSSTAVTLSFARRSNDDERGRGSIDALAAGILLAWSVMFARVLVEVAVVNPPLLGSLLVPMVALGLLSAGTAAVFHARGRAANDAAGGEVPLRNPFSLRSAIRFALFFAAVLLLVKLVEAKLPPSGLYGVAALAGLTDVDAITLSMAENSAAGAVAPRVATTAIVIAALANSLVKAALVLALATPALRRRIVAATGVLIAGAAVALLVA